MSLEQCKRCIYRDIVVVEGGIPLCPIAELPEPGDPCKDYEEADPSGDRRPEPRED